MRTKKVRKSRQTFRSVGNPSEMLSVMVQTDTCQTCAVPSVMPSVWDVGNAVGDGADGHVSDMRAENPSVMPSVLASENPSERRR